MSDDVKHVWRWFKTDRKTARAMYADCFGRAFDDPSVDAELAELFGEYDDGATLPVPASLVLALVMRAPPGKGRGKMRPRREVWKRRVRGLVVRSAENGWARRVAAGEPSKRAKHDAAVEAHRKIKGHGLSVGTIESRMNLARGKRDIAKQQP